MENWLTSSVKERESALILRRYAVHGTFFALLCRNEYSYRLEGGVSENLCSFLKEVKPVVLYSVEKWIAMEPMNGKKLHLELIWGTPSYFAFLKCISVHLAL